MYVTHTARNSKSFPSHRYQAPPDSPSLFSTSYFSILNRNWTACCFPPARRGRHRASVSAFRTPAPLHARSYTRRARTLAFALAPPPCACITPDLPLVVRQTPTFGNIGTFVPSASEPRPRTPRTAPALPLRRTVTSAPARMYTASIYWTRTCSRPLILRPHPQSVDLALVPPALRCTPRAHRPTSILHAPPPLPSLIPPSELV
jgi:hypothetical protein